MGDLLDQVRRETTKAQDELAEKDRKHTVGEEERTEIERQEAESWAKKVWPSVVTEIRRAAKQGQDTLRLNRRDAVFNGPRSGAIANLLRAEGFGVSLTKGEFRGSDEAPPEDIWDLRISWSQED